MPQNSLRLAFRRATSLKEGGKAASPHERVNYNFSYQKLMSHYIKIAQNYNILPYFSLHFRQRDI